MSVINEYLLADDARGLGLNRVTSVCLPKPLLALTDNLCSHAPFSGHRMGLHRRVSSSKLSNVLTV